MGAASESVTVEKDTPSRTRQAPSSDLSAAPTHDTPSHSRIVSAAAESPTAAAHLISQTGPNPAVLQRAQRSFGNRASQQIVMRARAIQRKCDCGGTCEKCQEEEGQRVLQRCAADQASPVFNGIPSSQGEPLNAETLHPLETHFQSDLSDVRVHTNTEAAESATALDAHAFTAGRDIYFADGMYSPATTGGQRLLAHEVAHVVQQSSGKEPTVAMKSAHGVKIGASDDILETEADQAAETFLRQDGSQSAEREHSLSQLPASGSKTILRQPAPTTAPIDQTAIQDTASTIADAVLKDDITTVVTLMRKRSIAELVSLRTAVRAKTNVNLERWFITKLLAQDQQKRSRELGMLTSVVSPTIGLVNLAASALEDESKKSKVNEGPLAEEGLRWLWYALPLIDRLEIYDEGYREIEQAQLDAIKHASDQEKAEAKKETKRLESVYDKMDAKEEYDARTMIDPSPDGLLDAATKLLNQADDVFWKHKDLLYTAVLALAPAARSQFFDQHETKLQEILWHNDLRDEFSLLKSMAHADEAAALIVRLRLATAKTRSDDMEAVQAVVDRAVALLGEKRGLTASLSDPHLSAADRGTINKRLGEIGDVEGLLQMHRVEKGKLDPESFMGMISAARDDPYSFGVDAQRLGAFAPETTGIPGPESFVFQAAKQRLLLAGHDFEALTHTFLTIHAPHVQGAPGATKISAEIAQDQADVDFRKALLADPDVHQLVTSLVGSQQMHVLSAIPGDAFSERLYQLNQFRITAQWGVFFDLVLQIAQRDDWRDRYNATSSDPFGVFAGTFDEEREIMLEILRTRHMPLIALLKYTGNVATLQTAFANISKDDRERLREGWAISRNLVMGPLTVEQENARAVFLEFEAKVRDKLGKGSDFEDVLSAGLGSIPTMKEVSTPESRYQAAALMYERIEARLALDRGLAAEFTETDETMVAAGRQFVALWLHVRDLHALTFVDFATLAELNDTFLSRSKEFAEASRAITDLAATIAATVAGLVVIAATGGAATPAVIALAAAAGAGTGIVTREMFGGDYYRIGSDEALKGALMDSINGALAVVSGGLAAKGTELIGLGGKTLVAGAARAAGTVAEEATVSFGQKLAASAVESAIDGFFSGAVSQGFDTLLDDRTWRKGIWAGLLQAGRAAIAAGLTGLATGGVLGSAAHIAGAGLSKISRAIFNQGLDKALARAGTSELLTAAREAAERGETAEVARLMDQMEAHLSNEEANLLRQDLNEQLREKLGHPPGAAKPATPQQQDLLRQSGLKDSGSALSKEEVDAEHFIVENSEPQISTEPGYVDEVDLGNGHTWRRAEDGTWCRFTTKSLCKTVLKAKPISPEAAARARRFEWEQRQARSAERELGKMQKAADLEKLDLDEFEKLLEQLRQDAGNGRKFRFKDLTRDQQSIIEQMFPWAEPHELEALDYVALEQRRLQALGTKDAPGAVTRLEQRVPVLEAELTTAKQPLAQRLRSVPADIERNMTRRAAGLDEFAKVKPVSGRLSIEHVYPLSKIMAMEGFFALDEAQMKILASWERNLKMTDLEANILRKERGYSELSSLEFGKYYSPQGLEAAAKLEHEMEIELKKELDRMRAGNLARTLQRSPAGRGQSPTLHSIAPPDGGQMLPASLRIALESHFRMDLSGIRIHADASAAESAQSLDAHAYATSRDIYFSPGMYAPTTDAGKRLLVHEVAHVVQQSSGKEPTVATKSTCGAKIGAPDDILETEADQAADALLHKDAHQTEDEKRNLSLSSSSSVPTVLRQPVPVNVAPADTSAQDIAHAQPTPLVSQNQQSNRENIRLIQRQPVPDQGPTPEAGVATISAEDAQSVLRERITLALARCTSPPADILSFVDQVKASAQAELAGKLRDEDLTSIATRADQVRGVSAEVVKETFDYVSALQLLVRVLGLPADTGVPNPSYGTAAYIRQVSNDVSGYLVIPLYKMPPFYFAHTTEILSGWFAILLQQLGDPKNYLRLELEGSLQRLVELRASFEKAKTPADAAPLGQAIGETARRVLLLNDALESMGDNAFDPTSPLEDRLAGIAPQVDQIRAAAQQEKTTLAALGDLPGLLKPKEIPVDLAILSDVDPTSIAPEEAFPQASDRATEGLLSDLDARVLARATTADQLRNQIIPTSPTYDLLEFATMYRRWFAFFSPAARDMDPFYVQMRQLYRGIYNAEGMGGIEGGFGRALLMRSIGNYVSGALGEASPDFASDVSELNLRRRESVTGTAQNPRYEFGELFAPDSADLSTSGEDTSRNTALAAKTASSREAMEKSQFLAATTGVPGAVAAQSTRLIPNARNSVVVFHDVTAQDTWNYLLRTRSMTPGFEDINIYEQKEMPPEITRYLLAQQQLQRTLQQSHKPGFGDTAAALGGVEEGRAVGTQRYLHGEDRNTTNPKAEYDKASIANVARKYGVERDAKGKKESDPTDALLRDLEAYLNQFFAAQTEPAQRIAAVLLIAQLEHNVGKQFTRYFTGEELKKAIAFVLALTGIKALLGRFGPVGEAISMALDQGLQLMGVTPGAAMVPLLAWLVDTGQTSTFSEARVQAFFAFDIIDDLGQLAQQYAIQGAVAGIHLAAMRGPEPKNLAELANRFEPLLEDPRVRDAFLKRVDSEIAIRQEKGGGRDFSDPELDQLRSLAARLREQSVANAPDAVDIPLRPTPIEGGTRGVDVYRLAGSTIGRTTLLAEVDGLAGRKFVGDATFARIGPASSGRYQLTVGEAKVGLVLEASPDAVFNAGISTAHQGESGPVRFALQRDTAGQWTATIQLHERVGKGDVEFLVSHELNEISDIVSGYPSATPEVVARETKASIFEPGRTSDIVTAHDRAAARELAELAENIELRKGKLSPDMVAIRDEQARLDRMLRAMGLDQGFTPADPRVQVLREAGIPGSVMMDINNGAVGKRYAQNLREPVKATDILGAEPTMVGRPGHARSKHEITKDQQADVLNNYDKVYSGVNESGRHVDVYWKGDQLVITDAGMKQRVITSYEHDFKTWTSANPNMRRIK